MVEAVAGIEVSLDGSVPERLGVVLNALQENLMEDGPDHGRAEGRKKAVKGA